MRRALTYFLAGLLFVSQAWAGLLLNPYRLQSTAAQNIFQTVTALGLTSNLQFCLDAGEGDSYTSGQKWLDLTANDQDFFVGATVGSEASDPAFNGVADALSSAEFFSFDGGDLFRYDTTNETWMDNLAKDNAAFTIIAWATLKSDASATQAIFGNRGAPSGGNIGAAWRSVQPTAIMQFTMRDGTTGQNVGTTSSSFITEEAFSMLSISLDEAAGAGALIFGNNGTFVAQNSTYTAPAGANASFTTEIGAGGNADSRFLSGAGIASICAWSAALTQAQIFNVFVATRTRFGV